MSARSRRTAALVGALAVPLLAVPLLVTPAGAIGPTSYTVPSGVEVVEVVLVGGSGGDTVIGGSPITYGGVGCRVQAALPVDAGATITWTVGNKGGSPERATGNQPGAAGGNGARPGGAGGAVTNFPSPTPEYPPFPGAGGGGASSVSVGGSEAVIAAGGGGASSSTSGGNGCTWYSPEGGDGGGSGEAQDGGLARGATDPLVGGAGGTGSYQGLAGGSGASSSAATPGAGGTGGSGKATGSGGGGGGGGISGGGGGGGHGLVEGSVDTGAAGLSGVLLTADDLLKLYRPGTGTEDAALSVNVIQIPALPTQTTSAGASFAMTLGASFAPVLVADVTGATLSANAATVGAITWSLADGSPSLPAGLSLDPAGRISGSPSAAGTTTVTLAATAFDDDPYDGGDYIRARSLTTLTFVVGTVQQGPPPPAPSVAPSTDPTSTVPASTTTEPPTTTTTSPASPITAQTEPPRPGTLPATGSGSRAITLGAFTTLLVGAGTLLLARRRAR